MSNPPSEVCDTMTEDETPQSIKNNDSKKLRDSTSSSLDGSNNDSDSSTQSGSPPFQKKRPSILAQHNSLSSGASSKMAISKPSNSAESHLLETNYAKNCNQILFLGNRSRASEMVPKRKIPPSDLTLDLCLGSSLRPKQPLILNRKRPRDFERQSPLQSGLLESHQNKRRISWQDNNYLHHSVGLHQRSSFRKGQNFPNRHSDSPNPRGRWIMNTLYDPTYERMGVPIDPLLRCFLAKHSLRCQ